MPEPTPQSDMTAGDFQQLLQIALSDLTIRRTLLENQIRQLQEEPRSLEQENAIDQADQEIQDIAKDYRHYKQYVDPSKTKHMKYRA